MDDPKIQKIAQELQAIVGVKLDSGHLTLNFNEGRVQSVQAMTYLRVQPDKSVDRTGK